MYVETSSQLFQLFSSKEQPTNLGYRILQELSRPLPITNPEASNTSFLQTIHLSQNFPLHIFPFPSSTANVNPSKQLPSFFPKLTIKKPCQPQDCRHVCLPHLVLLVFLQTACLRTWSFLCYHMSQQTLSFRKRFGLKAFYLTERRHYSLLFIYKINKYAQSTHQVLGPVVGTGTQ